MTVIDTARVRARRLLTGPDTDPEWARPALFALLVATACLYLWGLSASGWANSFYSAAVQAGSRSWEAFFYGSSDAANAITVDKPPASLWVMGLSVRLFGLSSWAILVPQALMGVATVGVLYATVRRVWGIVPGLVAGAALALTPVAALMFRFNNPDALLVLLMTLAAWATVRAVQDGRTRWMILVGALIGVAFLTKTLQAFLVVPGFAAAYLAAAPVSWGRRIRDVLLAGLALLVTGGWWVAVVELVPASARPYIGGSQTNSFLDLTFGYNGFGRLTGEETGSVGGGGGNGVGHWGQTGITRLLGTDSGGQIAWLLPAALLLLVAGLWLRGRAPRTDLRRATLVVLGSWAVVTWLTFSLMAGIFHAYYNVALAPALAGLVAAGAAECWERRGSLAGRVPLAAAVGLTAATAFLLLARTPDWYPWLRWAVVVTGFAAALLLLAAHRLPRAVAASVLGVALIASLAGPAAYTLATVTTPHRGSIVSAGPAVAGMGGPGGRPGGGAPAGDGAGPGGQGGALPGGTAAGSMPQPPAGAGQAAMPQVPAGTDGGSGSTGGAIGAPGAGSAGQGDGRGGPGGGMGGLLDTETPSAEVVAALQADAASFTWVAAAIGSQTAAGLQLGSGEPVMAVGGFNGSDPSPTLAQFQAYVAAGRIHYFVAGGMGGGGMGQSESTSAQISAWVQENFAQVTLGGTTFYDLTRPVTSTDQSTQEQ